MSLVRPTLCSAIIVGHLLGDSGDRPFDRHQTTRLSRLTRGTYTAIKFIPRQVGMGSECLDNDTLSSNGEADVTQGCGSELLVGLGEGYCYTTQLMLDACMNKQ